MAELPSLPAVEAAIVRSTNESRRAEGRQPVSRNAVLDQAARRFAEFLATSGLFAHEADGRQPADRAKAAGYAFCSIAENLALNLDSRGFSSNTLADEAMDGWKKSPGHRKNMLLAHVTEIGVGIAQAPGRDPKFLSVQLFGRPQRLAYTFRVQNASSSTISFTFGGETQDLEPRVSITFSACDPGQIRFVKSNGWFGGAQLDVTHEAVDQARYVLRNAAEGRLTISVER